VGVLVPAGSFWAFSLQQPADMQTLWLCGYITQHMHMHDIPCLHALNLSALISWLLQYFVVEQHSYSLQT
jgi:hypothetical protein